MYEFDLKNMSPISIHKCSSSNMEHGFDISFKKKKNTEQTEIIFIMPN